MTTLIRIKDAVFTNADLPTLIPRVSRNLVAAYIFENGSTQDLSGNGYNLTTVGTPTVSALGFSGTTAAGYDTGVTESSSFTYIAVIKLNWVTNDAGGFIINNYNTTAKTGTAQWFGSITTTSTPVANGHAHLTDQTIARTQVALPSFASLNEYVFAVFSVDATNNTSSIYIPKLGVELLDKSYGSVNVANRPSGGTLRLVATSIAIGNFTNQVTMLEASIYNDSLTKEEVLKQYGYSKDYFANKHSISI